MSHITPNIVHENQSAALDRLRRGEIAAMFVVGGKPVPMLQGDRAGTGLHFLPIPLNAQLVDSYLPTSLDHQQYPNLVPAGPPIDTVAVSSVLVTLSTPSDTQRAKRVNRFVDALFDQLRPVPASPDFIQNGGGESVRPGSGLGPLSGGAEPAQGNQARMPTLRTSFDSYLNQSGQSISGMNNERREALFRDFLRWRDQHSRALISTSPAASA